MYKIALIYRYVSIILSSTFLDVCCIWKTSENIEEKSLFFLSFSMFVTSGKRKNLRPFYCDLYSLLSLVIIKERDSLLI